MAADGFTTIQRAVTVAEGEMFAELFRREGIEVHFHPMTRRQIGIASRSATCASTCRSSPRRAPASCCPSSTTSGANDEADEFGDRGRDGGRAGGAGRASAAADAGGRGRVPGAGRRRTSTRAGRGPDCWSGLALFCGLAQLCVASRPQRARSRAEMLFGALVALVFARRDRRAARGDGDENRGIHRSAAVSSRAASCCSRARRRRAPRSRARLRRRAGCRRGDWRGSRSAARRAV